MDAKINFKGMDITVPISGLSEAVRQLERVRLAEDLFGVPAPAPRQAPVQTAPAKLVDFLQLIADHELSGGVAPDEVQKVLGADHPKGIGSKMIGINTAIKAYGWEPSEVYTNDQRDSDGKRVWLGGPRLREALLAAKIDENKDDL